MKPQTLKQARTIAGLTQSALAEKAGVSRSAIARLEARKTVLPQQETVNLLAKALGTDSRGLITAMNRYVSTDVAQGEAPLRSASPRGQRSERRRAIEESGIVTCLPDGTYRIWLRFISHDLLAILLGEGVPASRVTAIAGSGDAYTYVHLRTIAEDLLYTITVESDDLPILRRVTDRGLVLQNAFVEPNGHSAADDGTWYMQQTLLPWDQVLSISVLAPRATYEKGARGADTGSSMG